MKLGNGEFTMEKENEFNKRLGYVLKKTRRAKKVYQPQIAEKLNVSKMAVSLWESGTNSMSAEQLKKYCDVLGVPVQYILDQTDTEL